MSIEALQIADPTTIASHLKELNANRRRAAFDDVEGFTEVHSESGDDRRWFIEEVTVLRHDETGLLYAVPWDRAKTEEGEHEFWDEVIHVERTERQVTRVEFVAEDGSLFGSFEKVEVSA